MPLPTNLPLLDYNIYGSPLLPQAKPTIDLELLDYGIYAQQFAANNISAAPATDKIAFIARTAYSSVSKVSTVSKASIGKISGVLAK